MADPSIIPRLQKLNLNFTLRPWWACANHPSVTCDACGSCKGVDTFEVVIGVSETFALCVECAATAFRYPCEMCRKFTETKLVRLADMFGETHYARLCVPCGADENMLHDRGKCELANTRRNYERITDMSAVEEMLQRQRAAKMKG